MAPNTTRSTALASLRTRVRMRWPELLLTALLVLTQLRDVFLAGPQRVIANPDVQLHYWTIWWWAQALRTDPWHVWDAPQFVPYPATLAFSDHLAPLGIAAAPLVWLGVPIALILQAAVVGAALATVWAVRAVALDVGASRWPALLVGLAVAFGAFRTTQLAHLQMQATWMLPAAALWLLQALRAPRLWSWPLVGVVIVCAVAFGLSVYHGLMLLPVLGVLGAAAVWQGPPDQRLARFVRLAVIAVCGALVALPSLYPYLVVQRTTAASRSLEELANWSAPLQAWVAVPASHPLWPRIFGETVLGRPELTLAPGLVLAVGVLIGLRNVRRAHLPWLVVVAMGGVLACGTTLRVWDGDAGIGLPFAGILARIPGYGALRVPARWGWVVVAGMAPLAALGWDALARRVRWWWIIAVVCLLLDQSWPQLPYLDVPQRSSALPVVQWLAASGTPKTMLELPLKPQVESDVQADRMWWQTVHKQRSVTGYSGLAPASQVLLARDAAHLPRADVLARITALGVERVVVYRGTPEGDAQAQAIAACETCILRYDGADAVVSDLAPSVLLAPTLTPGQHVWMSGDARLPDLVALGLLRAWQRAGVVVAGPARERFYPALPLSPELPDAWLLGATEEPESVGVTPSDAAATAAGATLYRRPPALIAAQPVAPPTASAGGSLTVTYSTAGEFSIDGVQMARAQAAQVQVVFDAALLTPQTIAGQTLPAGAQLMQLTLRRGDTQHLTWDAAQSALVRVRVFDRDTTLPALQSIPLRIDARLDEGALVLAGTVGVVQLQGIEDGSGTAVTHDIPTGQTRIAADSVPALLPGHYQVVVRTPHGQRIVVANLWIDGNGWRWQAIPLALTLVF